MEEKEEEEEWMAAVAAARAAFEMQSKFVSPLSLSLPPSLLWEASKRGGAGGP